MKFVNTNPHRILLVTDRGEPTEQRHQHKAGAEFDATGELADLAEDTNGVHRANSDEVAAWRSEQEIAEVAGSGDAVEDSFDPSELNADQAIEAIGRITDVDALKAVGKAEADGKDRKTVNEAVTARADELHAAAAQQGGTGTVTSDQVPDAK